MIQAVSYPSDLSQWKVQDQPFYLELFGETSPLLDMQYSEIVPAGSADGDPQVSQPAPVYEYYWTIGHAGHHHHRAHWHLPLIGDSQPQDMWEKLPGGNDDIVARVYLYFPRTGGWRIKELGATVKYLTPYAQQHSFLDRAAQDWNVIQPLVSDVGTLATAAGGLAGGPLGAAATKTAVGGAVNMLGALAKLQISSVPQTSGFQWSVGKVTFGSEYGVMQGIVWALPKNMFHELGGRITGSIGVSFIPAPIQVGDDVTSGTASVQKLPVLAHAVVYGLGGKDVWAPSEAREFTKLYVQPVVPTSAQTRS